MSRYRGRHRAPTNTRHHLAQLVTGAALAAAPLGLIPPAASAVERTDQFQAVTADIPWGKIVECESSGNPRATNGTHFGLLQFDLATWVSVGGAGNPMNASVEEQLARGRTLAERRGTQPWLASRHCWGGSTDTTPAVTAPAARPAPVNVAPSWAAAGDYTVRPGDTLSGLAAVRHTSWQAIYEANRAAIGGNPHLIFPGLHLRLAA